MAYMAYMYMTFFLRLHASISKQVENMNCIYEELEATQADAVANTLSAGLLSSLARGCVASVMQVEYFNFKDLEFEHLEKQGMMCPKSS